MRSAQSFPMTGPLSRESSGTFLQGELLPLRVHSGPTFSCTHFGCSKDFSWLAIVAPFNMCSCSRVLTFSFMRYNLYGVVSHTILEDIIERVHNESWWGSVPTGAGMEGMTPTMPRIALRPAKLRAEAAAADERTPRSARSIRSSSSPW